MLLKRSSRLNSIGYNLDIPGMAERTTRDFKNLLAQLPDDVYGNFYFGRFLAGANKPAESLPYLEAAANAGYVEALGALAVSHLTMQDMEAAVRYMKQYQQHNPDDPRAVAFIKAVESGNVEVVKN